MSGITVAVNPWKCPFISFQRELSLGPKKKTSYSPQEKIRLPWEKLKLVRCTMFRKRDFDYQISLCWKLTANKVGTFTTNPLRTHTSNIRQTYVTYFQIRLVFPEPNHLVILVSPQGVN
jgi:hypothetical protein